MTDDQRKAYEWAKSHDYPSIAARYAQELAGLVDNLMEAYDAMARDLDARTKQVRRLQAENASLRARKEQERERNNPLKLDELRKMDGEPVWCVSTLNEQSEWAILKVTEMSKTWFIAMAGASCGYGDKDTYGKTWLAYRHKPEDGTR